MLSHLCQLPVHHLQCSEAVVHARGGESVWSKCSVLFLSILSLAPWLPPARCCKHMPMEQIQWQMLGGAYIRGNYPGHVAFWWFAWDVEFTKIWVCLCSGFSVTICLSSQVLVTFMCSHSPSVLSSADCSILPCWCLLEEPLDSFGYWVISRAATHPSVNLPQVATSYLPSPFQCR